MDQNPKRKRSPPTSPPGPDVKREGQRISLSSQVNSIQSGPSTSPLKATSLEAGPANALVVRTNNDHDRKALVLAQRRLMLSQDHTLALFQEKLTSLRVLLPDNTTVSVVVALNEQTKIKNIIHETILEHQKSTSDGPKEKNEREIDWSSSWLETMTGEILQKVHLQNIKTQTSATLVLQDGRPNTAHSHEHLWDLTPQPQMLGKLPQGYSLHTALADEVDNALQAVWENAGNKRLIRGTLGRTKHREKNREGIGGQPPFLRVRVFNRFSLQRNPLSEHFFSFPRAQVFSPYLGKYGAGGVAAALHLGRSVKVSSKTLASKRVVTLVMDLQGFEDRSDTKENLWKTMGSFREMTDDEREKAPHGSFTKVEITHLKDQYCISKDVEHKNYWKVTQLKRQLKDIYYLYIQSDDGISSKTTCPVSFVVNNEDLLEVTDCEISISNMHSCNGEPFICDMEFVRPVDDFFGFTKEGPKAGNGLTISAIVRPAAGSRHENVIETAHLRLKCDYFPNITGRETLQEVLEKLEELDKDYPYSFETMPRVGVRWLGRLLPDAKWPILPFMEVTHHKQGEARLMWTRRVKAFIETDAGFHPTQSKTELEKDHPFTVALRKLGASHDRIEGVRIRIRYMDKQLPVEELPKAYMRWLQKMHDEFDNEVTFLDQPTFIFHQQSLRELKVHNKQVAILHKKMNYNGNCIWDIKDAVPIRLKFGRGCPGIKGPLWATLEYFYCGGVEDEKGEVQTVCRPIEVADEDGSKLEEVEGQCIFHLKKSLCFSFSTLVSDKCNRVGENEWNNQLKKYGDTSPGFLEILNQEDSEHFGLKQALPQAGTLLKAGYTLPEEVLVVVRPRKGNGASFKKGKIISEPMRVQLTVTFKSSGVSESRPSSSITKDETEQSQELLHETVSQSIIHPSGVKGLYSFHTKGTNFSRLIRMGEYIFHFELINDDYRLVQPALCILKVEAADGRSRWSLCNHLGPCSERHCLSIRLNEQLKQALFVQKLDEYGNIQPLEKLEEVKLVAVGRKGECLEISTIRSIADPEITVKERQSTIIIKDLLFDEGNLSAIQPDREALLQLHLHGEKVAETECSVFPGDIFSIELISGTPFERISYHPLEIIQQVTIQARDKFRNNAARGQKLIVLLDGLEFVNGSDSWWEVDENGQIQLGGSLKVIAPFNRKGTIRIKSDSNLDLLELQVNIVNRFLRTWEKWPRKVFCGRQLEGLFVEVVDEQGRRDTAINGRGLAVSWVPNATFLFTQGVCALPSILLPDYPGIWVGTAFLPDNHDITLRLEVEVEMAAAIMLASSPCGPIIAKSGEPFALRFRTVDERMQPGILTQNLKAGLAVTISSSRSLEFPDPVGAPVDQIVIRELEAGAGMWEALVTLSRKTGTYFLKLSHVGPQMEGMVEWKVTIEHGKLSKLVPFLRSTEGESKHIKSEIRLLQVAVRDFFPSLVIELLDSEDNLCIRYDTGVLNLLCRNCPEWNILSAEIKGGKAMFDEFVMQLDPGNYEAYFGKRVKETDSEPKLPVSCSIALQVILGNYPSQLTIEAEPAIEIYLSETVRQFLPETAVKVYSPDGRRLKNRVKLVTKVLETDSNGADGTNPEIVCCHASNSDIIYSDAVLEQSETRCGNSKYICNGLPVPRRAGKYVQLIYLDEPSYHVDPISRPFLVKHGPPHQIAICHETIGEELQQLEVKVLDTYGNLCSESSGKLALNFTLDEARTLPTSDSISEPCHILSRSTGDLIAGICRFDKFEISIGIAGMYHIRVFYEVRSEHVISSERIQVLATSGNLVKSVVERIRNLQSSSQELKAKAQEMTQVHEDLASLNDRLARLQKKIANLNDDVTDLREQKGRLKAIHLKDKKNLKEFLDNTVRTREDVQKEIVKLPWPLSSPLNICERMRKSQGTNARANTILDMVIMLAAVENSRFNRSLSVYLGCSDLLMIVCETHNELEELNAFNEWDGRCEVICLEEICSRGIPLATNHRQQLLKLPEPSWNGRKRAEGFLGFAVNFIHLKSEHLHLRRTLFYHLLGESQVYDTEENMRMALKFLSPPHHAMSLDGAFVKDPNIHQLGRGDPIISFPSVSFAERSQCSLIPPACHAFEREKRWNALGKQILDRLTDIGSCKEQIADIGLQITELERKFIIQKEDHNELHEMVKHLADQVDAIRPVAELIHPTLPNENEIRVFLVPR